MRRSLEGRQRDMAANFSLLLGNKRDGKVSGEPQIVYEPRLSVAAKRIGSDTANGSFVSWVLMDNVYPPNMVR